MGRISDWSSFVVDWPPTDIALANAITGLAEDTDTSGATKMGDIVITDADGGTNAVSLSGTDAPSFEVVGSELRLKAGVALDYETKTSYAVTLTTGSVSVGHTLAITNVAEGPTAIALNENGSPVQWAYTNGDGVSGVLYNFDAPIAIAAPIGYTVVLKNVEMNLLIGGFEYDTGLQVVNDVHAVLAATGNIAGRGYGGLFYKYGSADWDHIEMTFVAYAIGSALR